jgi:glucuronate isomerase
MRASGVPEEFITGRASDEQKFMAWAETLPKLLGNPLFHWTHLELKRYFGISGKVLCPETASEIYRVCNRRAPTQTRPCPSWVGWP